MAERSIPSTAARQDSARGPPPAVADAAPAAAPAVADAAPAVASTAGAPSKVEKAITAAHKDIVDLLKQKNVAAAFLKLAFFDAATYDAKSRSGGPNGSIRLREDSEKDDLLRDAIKKLGDLKAGEKTREQYQYISYADLYQLAGVEATNMLAGRTIIGFEPGRMDSSIPPSTKLPSLTGDEKVSDVRELFYRMGFDDKEIVALSWAYYYWETCKASTSTPQGGSTEVTTTPIKLDNSYYKSLKNLAEAAKKEKEKPKSGDNKEAPSSSSSAGEAAAARTEKLKYYWKCLLEKPFEEHVITYATKEDQFVKDFAAVHKKISQLGFKEPEAPVTEYHDMRPGLAVAVSMAILIGVLGFFYEAIRT